MLLLRITLSLIALVACGLNLNPQSTQNQKNAFAMKSAEATYSGFNAIVVKAEPLLRFPSTSALQLAARGETGSKNTSNIKTR